MDVDCWYVHDMLEEGMRLCRKLKAAVREEEARYTSHDRGTPQKKHILCG